VSTAAVEREAGCARGFGTLGPSASGRAARGVFVCLGLGKQMHLGLPADAWWRGSGDGESPRQEATRAGTRSLGVGDFTLHKGSLFMNQATRYYCIRKQFMRTWCPLVGINYISG
jgi:hypothetical protein